MEVRLRKLRWPEDGPALQRVLEAAPRYALNVSGDPQPSTAAEDVFAALPEGFDRAKKFVYGIEYGQELVGCIDILRGYSTEERAMLGLLLLSEEFQGKGIAREAVELIERKVADWPEIKKIRISVVETNSEVLGFWHKMGFKETGDIRPYESGKVISQAIVLEKLV